MSKTKFQEDQEIIFSLRAQVAALKDELERWKAPLSDEQMNRFVYKWIMNGENLPGIDAAIRQVRSDG